jgi:hypothetical protein
MGPPPLQTCLDTIPLAQAKVVAAEALGQEEHPDNEEAIPTWSDPVVTHAERAPLRGYEGTTTTTR